MRDDVMQGEGLEEPTGPEVADGRGKDDVPRDGAEASPSMARWPRALDDVPTVRRRGRGRR